MQRRGVAWAHPPRLAAVVGELVEDRELARALGAGRIAGGERLDQAADPVADLKGEVGGGGPGEGADVLGGHLAPGGEAVGSLRLAHGFPCLPGLGIGSASASAAPGGAKPLPPGPWVSPTAPPAPVPTSVSSAI